MIACILLGNVGFKINVVLQNVKYMTCLPFRSTCILIVCLWGSYSSIFSFLCIVFGVLFYFLAIALFVL